jgi:phage gpG-like protein
MRLTLKVDTTDGIHKIDVIVESLKDLDPVLKAFSKYMRKRVQERFSAEGPGWPRLSSSTLEHRETRLVDSDEQIRQLAQYRLRLKLRRELRRAKSKFSLVAYGQRKEVLDEFDRLVAGAPGSELAGITDVLKQRLERAVAKEERKRSSKVLGRMASSIASSVNNGRLTIWSRIPWSAVHNEGGVAGHGAKIPERTFLTIEEKDLNVLVALLLEYLHVAA